MFRLFAGNQPLVLALLPILSIANLVMAYYFPVFTEFKSYETNLWGVLVQDNFNWFLGGLSAGLIVLNGILINITFNRHEFFARNTYLPALVYVIFATLFPMSTIFNGEALAQTFLILMIMQLFQLKQNEDGRAACFNSSFFLALASTLNPIYFLLFPFLWLGILRIRPFVFREYALTIAGVVVPFLSLLYVHPDFYQLSEKDLPLLEYTQLEGRLFLVAYLATAILLLVSFRFVLSRFPTSNIRYKRLFSLISVLLIYSFLVAFITNLLFDTDYYASVGVVVLAFVTPYAYLDARVKSPTVLLYLVIIATSVMKFIT
jgi:hypothetical protein